eukprot:GHVO01006295.1.p1 GENE.GHVO01006295.1~~GHVO01006295.1.p1  ORF type:complete len:114 (-),score=6.85 GHVO01006295.1:196-537(-)
MSLKEVPRRLEEAGLTLKTSIKYLGHIVDEHGITPDPDKITAIQGSHIRQIPSAITGDIYIFKPSSLNSQSKQIRCLLRKDVDFNGPENNTTKHSTRYGCGNRLCRRPGNMVV